MNLLARLAFAMLGTAMLVVAIAPPALADAPGPTNYRTDIVSVEPADSPIRLEMIGGDSFILLEQLDPVEVIVQGYQAEPYLRFDSDGTVYENLRSPAVWLNQERYGDEEVPTFANAQATPQWSEVATGGTYAWHDHRSHWMNPQPPPSAESGDQVLEATVPLTVDGQPVLVTVASYLLDPPSLWPSVAGAVVGLAGALAIWKSTRAGQALVTLLNGGLAVALGLAAYRAVPSVTQPSSLLWLLPAIAVAAVIALVALRNHTATTVYLDGLIVAAGATLGGWGFTRLDALRRSLIPSSAPAGLDRLIIMSALLIGAGLVLRGLYGLLNPQRLQLAKVSA